MLTSKNLLIKSRQGDYQVLSIDSLTNLKKYIHEISTSWLIIIDNKVSRIYSEFLNDLDEARILIIESNESTKTLDGVSEVLKWLISKGADKNTQLIGIGGGVVQDVTTFVSHIYHRGISWIFVPTTLLSQSDSCIGAKCGINVGQFKNQIGVINSPKSVLLCSEFLRTNDTAMIRSGLGEMLKLSVTGTKHFYIELEKVLKNGIASDLSNLDPYIIRSLEAKQEIIEIDEYENDLRRILNYGHTFGHALEAITNHEIDHGSAVVFGMDIINHLATKWGETPKHLTDNMRHLFEVSGFNLKVSRKIRADEFLLKIRRDKKTINNIVHFAVLKDIGNLSILPRQINDTLEQDVAEYLSGHPLFTFN